MCFVTISRAQTEDVKLKKLESVWILDSLYVNEIVKDKTASPVDYNTIQGIDPFIFNRLDLLSGKKCILYRKYDKVSYGIYDILENSRLLFEYEETVFQYNCQLTEYLTLEGEFTGGTPEGLLAQYRIFMRFKRQSNNK
jgi:hypothetical protein